MGKDSVSIFKSSLDAISIFKSSCAAISRLTFLENNSLFSENGSGLKIDLNPLNSEASLDSVGKSYQIPRYKTLKQNKGRLPKCLNVI